MKPERWQLVKEILEETLDAREDARAAFLDERCAGDPELRKEVEALLAADKRAADFLEPLDVATAGVLSQGEAIGPYRILRLIGEGGMGEVYEAEQAKPIRRKVALKFVKLGMDTKQVLARFDTERQALALMSHPNIARVFDVGATDKGRPYFVMEYVPGVPVSEYCDTNHLGAEERLELFVQICEGVHHAHQKGIIHRDIKPSNVLVSLVDGKPVPKIIDFGVAKATAQRLTEATFFTELGQAVGTPEYMSPEQTEVTAIDIDIRTDVYSLGVLLYELLTGARPFNFRGEGVGFDEMRRRIREEEPTRPSTRARELSQTSPDVARNRRTDPGTLVRLLQGDLDWITLKALEKDRSRRYASVSELVADIERHLSHQPVLAGPTGTSYRVGKFVRRHRLGVGAAAAVVVALVVGVAAATVGLVRAQRAEAQARQEAETAGQVSDFLVELFEVSDPFEAKGDTLTVREILERGAEKVTTELQDQPLVQARLMSTMGRVYRNLGLYPEAESLLQEALRTRERLLGEESLEVAFTLHRLGILYREQDRYDQAAEVLSRCVAIRESLLGPEDETVLGTMEVLAQILTGQGKFEEAEPIFLRALDAYETKYGDDHLAVAGAHSNLAVFHAHQGKLAEAEPFFQRALDIRTRTLGESHPRVIQSLHNLAQLYEMQERYAEAEALFLRAVPLKEKVFGERHPDTANSLVGLADVYVAQGRYAEAEPLFERALAVLDETVSEDHPQVTEALLGQATLRRNQSRFQDAERLYRRALALREAKHGPAHPSVAEVREAYAGLLREAGRVEEARALEGRVVGAPGDPSTSSP